jgi:hypothetical protein
MIKAGFQPRLLKCFTIFLLVLVLQHAEVGGIATLADKVLLYCLYDCTAWLVGMGAIAIFAIG